MILNLVWNVTIRGLEFPNAIFGQKLAKYSLFEDFSPLVVEFQTKFNIKIWSLLIKYIECPRIGSVIFEQKRVYCKSLQHTEVHKLWRGCATPKYELIFSIFQSNLAWIMGFRTKNVYFVTFGTLLYSFETPWVNTLCTYKGLGYCLGTQEFTVTKNVACSAIIKDFLKIIITGKAVSR